MFISCDLIEKSLKDNFVVLTTIKDESSLLHAVFFAFSQQYRTSLKEERLTLITKIRRRLAAHMASAINDENSINMQQQMISTTILDDSFLSVIVQLIKINIMVYYKDKWKTYGNNNSTVLIIKEKNNYSTVAYQDNNYLITYFNNNDDIIQKLI